MGPPYYNAWVQPLGLLIFALMGIGTLFGWKKTSPAALRRASIAPTAAMVVMGAAHQLHNRRSARLRGFLHCCACGATQFTEEFSAHRSARSNAFTPLIGFALCVFNAAIIIQEFALLFRARKRSGAGKDGAWLWPVGFVFSVITVLGLVLMRKSFPSATAFGFTVIVGSLVALVAPFFLFTLVSLPHASRRRYGGYIVHFGIVFLFLGFTGKSWTVDRETTLAPHEHYSVAGYDLEYLGPRMELDVNKRMVFGDLAVTRDGARLGLLTPAKFMYKKMPDSPTTEVSMMHSLRDDLYLVVGSINPQTKVASFQIHINPLVSWIWFGAIILIFGSIVSMWPELRAIGGAGLELRARRSGRGCLIHARCVPGDAPRACVGSNDARPLQSPRGNGSHRERPRARPLQRPPLHVRVMCARFAVVLHLRHGRRGA